MTLPQRAPAPEPEFTPFESFAWANETAIYLANYFRVLSLILGVAIAALYVRIFVIDRCQFGEHLPSGWAARTGALVLLATTSCMFQYDRIDDPVTILLPLNVVGLGLAVLGLYRLPMKPPPNDEWLREDGP